jgi:hypothetical protein
MSNVSLPQVYLGILVVLLAIACFAVLRQVFRTRRTEMDLRNLQRKLGGKKGNAQDHYELGSILLGKKLYSQAITEFRKGLKSEDLEPGIPTALIYNALGYGYACH